MLISWRDSFHFSRQIQSDFSFCHRRSSMRLSVAFCIKSVRMNIVGLILDACCYFINILNGHNRTRWGKWVLIYYPSSDICHTVITLLLHDVHNYALYSILWSTYLDNIYSTRLFI